MACCTAFVFVCFYKFDLKQQQKIAQNLERNSESILYPKGSGGIAYEKSKGCIALCKINILIFW